MPSTTKTRHRRVHGTLSKKAEGAEEERNLIFVCEREINDSEKFTPMKLNFHIEPLSWLRFTAVNRHHGQGTVIRTTFNWGWLTSPEVQSTINKVGTWQHPGRHGTGGAESSTSSSEGC